MGQSRQEINTKNTLKKATPEALERSKFRISPEIVLSTGKIRPMIKPH